MIGVFTIGALGVAASLMVFVFEVGELNFTRFSNNASKKIISSNLSQIYHYWHVRILARRARMRDPWNVRNLARIAQIHFTTHEQYSDIDVMRLVDAFNATSSSSDTSTL